MAGKDPKLGGASKTSAHASRPRDFGAPDPKPSRKVALDEVLRSLQDLVTNELNVESPTTRAPDARAAKARAVKPAAVDLEIATDHPATAGHRDTAAPQTDEPVTAVAPSPNKTVVAGGMQQELPHLEPEPALKPEIATPASAPAEPQRTQRVADETESLDTELPELQAAPTPETNTHHAPHTDDHNHTPTDIPVLDDVVEEIEELETAALPASGESTASLPLATLPEGMSARRLAIQVAARLNVELRREGKPVLSSAVIARLAHALEVALAPGDANRENTKPEQH